MSKPKVFVTRIIPEVGLQMMREACEIEVWPERLPPSYEVLTEKIKGIDGLVPLLTDRIDGALLDQNPNLLVVSQMAVGFNNIDIAACTERGIPVGNTPGVLTDATADMAASLLMAAGRRLLEGWQDASGGNWLTWEPLGHIGPDFAGATLGILGMGRIGFAMASRMHKGFGMKVLYTDLYRNEAAEKELGATKVELDELLGQSDFVSIHTNLDETTKGLFGKETFAKMKPTAVLVNTARGPIVDHDALDVALREGQIFAAGLDVTDPEPFPTDHPLFKNPRALIAPHIASATVRTRDAMATICANNLLAGLKGEDLPCWVNPEVKATRRTR